MMELDANTQLYFHWIPIIFGLFLMSPFGEGLGKSLSSRWQSLATLRGRTLGGMMAVMFGGSQFLHTPSGFTTKPMK